MGGRIGKLRLAVELWLYSIIIIIHPCEVHLNSTLSDMLDVQAVFHSSALDKN